MLKQNYRTYNKIYQNICFPISIFFIKNYQFHIILQALHPGSTPGSTPRLYPWARPFLSWTSLADLLAYTSPSSQTFEKNHPDHPDLQSYFKQGC